MPLILRKQDPPAYRNYKRYKPFLRLDCQNRCSYCHIPELRYGPPRNYTVDHFRPKSHPRFRKLICAYSNLFYVCQDCNSAKHAVWPKPQLERLGFRFLDPCLDEFGDHWTIERDGTIHPLSNAGEYMAAMVQLNRPYLRSWRREKEELLRQIREMTRLDTQTLGTRQNPPIRRVLASLERRMTSEFGDFWQVVR